MAKQKGRELLVKIGDGAGTEAFDILCGLITKSLVYDVDAYDVTTAACTSPGGPLYSEVQDGVRKLTVSGNGFFEGSAQETRLLAVANSTTRICNLRIIVPGLGRYDSDFFLSSLGFTGEQNGGMTYDISFVSTGGFIWVPS